MRFDGRIFVQATLFFAVIFGGFYGIAVFPYSESDFGIRTAGVLIVASILLGFLLATKRTDNDGK